MSFSKIVKEEIIKKNIFKVEQKAFLQGMFLSMGSLIISKGNLYFVVSNENEAITEFLKQNLESYFSGVKTTIVKVVKNFKQKERFELSVDDEADNDKILRELGIIQEINGEVEISDLCDESYMQTTEKMTAFLAGMFLGTGTVSIPSENTEKRSYGYHFEIVLNSKGQADIVSEIMSHFDILPKQVCRNEQYVVYLKNSEAICDALSLFGASKSFLDIMNQKVGRDLNNNTNRQMNCYSANIDKTMNASVKQMKAIEIIQKTIGIENLPEALAETALARISNPEASLKDLLNALDNKISKGALAQRFNKIIEIANGLGEENE